MSSWLVETLGAVVNGIALILLTIWATVFIPREDTHAVQSNKRRQQTNGLSSQNHRHRKTPLLALVGLLIGGSIILQCVAAFRHYSYDTERVLRYDDKFNAPRMIQARKDAAALVEYRSRKNKNWGSLTNGTDGLDDVLGFLDTLGYDLAHDQVSADVVHEYFYDDIVGYYHGSEKYITYSQASDSATAFGNVNSN